MMKLVVLSALIAAALADVSHILKGGADIPIVRLDSDQNPDGSYRYAYETGNGISAQEDGTIKQVSQDEVSKTAQGTFAWTSPEGEQISVQYVADENGYQPTGSHIPQPPPIPAQIQRALEWIAAHPEPEQPLKRL